MATAGDDIFSACFGCCTIAIYASLASWCTTQPFGSGRGSSSAGCCGSCCSKSFDEDLFEEQVRKDMEKTRDPNAVPSINESNLQQQQMAPSQGMAVTSDS